MCQLTTEEEEEEDDENNLHPDFHEFLSHFYRLIKSVIDQPLTSMKQFLLCQHASILSTFEILDVYRRKCLEAIGRCLLIHFGHYSSIVHHALILVDLVYSGKSDVEQRYQLMTSVLNDLIQRCQSKEDEEFTFVQCVTLIRVFLEHEKFFDVNQKDFKTLTDSLVKRQMKN